MKRILLLSILMFGGSAYADDCHPQINTAEKNYIVGYGSLINDQSRQRTNPTAKNVYPIEVHGFERLWGLRATGTFKGTFLLAVPMKGASFNGVYYPTDYNGVLAADEREHDYCRYRLDSKDIKSIGLKKLQEGQYWMYASEPSEIKPANTDYPIIQSYVDIFIRGCLEIQDRYLIANYTEQCITTTKLWDNKSWVNDRVSPRRPSDSTPNASQIDKILSQYLGDEYYSHKYE